MRCMKKLACAVLAAGTLCTGITAFAADSPDKADIWLHNVYVNGRTAWGWTENNESAFHLQYHGSVYVQLRGVAEWMGKDVNWDESSKTITLSGSKEPLFHGNAKMEGSDLGDDEYDALIDNGTLVTERPDITVIVDGEPLELKDAAGNTIFPIVYNGTNYVPIRTVSEMLGMSVTFSAKPEAIYLRTPLTPEQDAACRTYIETLQAQMDAVKPYTTPHGGSIEELYRDKEAKTEIKDMATLKQAVQTCYDAVNTIKNTPKPDVKLVDFYYERMQEMLETNFPHLERLKAKVDSGADFNSCLDDYRGSPQVMGAETVLTRVEGAVYNLSCVIFEGK